MCNSFTESRAETKTSANFKQKEKPSIQRGEDPEPSVVDVWYPICVYTVTVQYKLLSELGELSHFILSVMDSHNLNLTQIEEITDLSQVQLFSVIERLKGLQLLNEDGITAKGKMLAYILRHVHDKELTLGLDRHYHHSYNDIDMLIVPGESSELKNIPQNVFVIPAVRQARYNITEDCFAQAARFQRKLPELLPKLIPEFETLLSQLGERWGLEWNVTIRQIDKNKGLCQSLPLKMYLNIKEQDKTHLILYTPALVLNTRFTLAEGFDWDDNLTPPEDVCTVYSDVDKQIYEHNNVVASSNPEFTLQGETYSLNLDVAKNMITSGSSQLNTGHELFSRNHSFTKAWQLHQYTYHELMDNLIHSDLIRG